MDYMFLSLAFFYFGVQLATSPMSMSLMLVLISMLAALSIGALFSKWFMFILLLVFSGGMMIMVLYIANLAAGLKTQSSNTSTLFFLLSLISIPLFSEISQKATIDSIMKLFSWEILVYLMMFLLFGLFLVVFLVDKSLGALR